MQYTKLLKGTALAVSLAAGCAFASSASAQPVVVGPYAAAYGEAYAPYSEYYGAPYVYADDYAPGPLALGADIIGGAVDVGLTAATVPFRGDDYDDGYRVYPSAYGYGYAYDYPRPEYGYAHTAYGNPYYSEYYRQPTVQQRARIAHHMNHHRHYTAYRAY